MVISAKLPKKIVVSLIWSFCVNTCIPPPSAVLLPRCCCHRRSHHAAATALPPSRCALPPLPLTLPPPQHCHIAAANIPLLCCHHRLSATKLPPTSRFCTAGTAAAAALLLPRCHRCAVCRCRAAATAALPPTSHCCAAAMAAAVAPLLVGWLSCCYPPSNFVIACCHVMRPSTLSRCRLLSPITICEV